MRHPLAALLALLVACSHGTEPSAPRPVSSDLEHAAETVVTLGVGQSATAAGLRVRFEEVEDDSRCPTDVLCAWSGDAAVRLSLEAEGKRAGTTLHTALEPRAVEYLGRTVRLSTVAPYPRSGAPVDSSAYVVTIGVRR